MPKILIAECKQEVSSFNPAPSHYEDFVVAFGAAVLALAVTALAPAGRIAQLAARRAQDDADSAAPPIVVTEM